MLVCATDTPAGQTHLPDVSSCSLALLSHPVRQSYSDSGAYPRQLAARLSPAAKKNTGEATGKKIVRMTMMAREGTPAASLALTAKVGRTQACRKVPSINPHSLRRGQQLATAPPQIDKALKLQTESTIMKHSMGHRAQAIHKLHSQYQ